MLLRRLELRDFRTYEHLTLDLSPGLTVVTGDNGLGKTNLVEAVAWPALLSSVRGVPNEALVRDGAETAIVRAEFASSDAGAWDVDGRRVSIDSEISARGRSTVLLNGRRGTRRRDVAEICRVTVFAPDDLELVKGTPSVRRRLLDDALIADDPRNDALRVEVDRILRQRNALLKQSHGRMDEAAEVTLAVWDAKLVERGTRLGERRAALVQSLGPLVQESYRTLSGRADEVSLRYDAAWLESGLDAALRAVRADEIRRGVTLVGPQRDDLVIELVGRPARTHASQGEQRTIALSLRLAIHRLLTDRYDEPPILVLDDVLSELDRHRRAALLASVPPGQTLLTTAADLPDRLEVAAHLDVVEEGRLVHRDAT